MSTYYLNASGSNTYPFNTSVKGAPYFDVFWAAMAGHFATGEAVTILLSSDIDADENDFTFDAEGNNIDSITVKSDIKYTKRTINVNGSPINVGEANLLDFEDIIFNGQYGHWNFSGSPNVLSFFRCYIKGFSAFTGSFPILIVKNNIFDTPASCVTIENDQSDGTSYIVNNIFAFGTEDIIIAGNLGVVQNNIFFGTNSSFIQNSALVQYNDNNIFYSGIPIDYMNWGSTVIGNNNLGLDVEPNGLYPRFVNPPAADYYDYSPPWDFHLTPTSPCLDAGINDNAPVDDYEGNIRDNPTDIGAYQSPYEPVPPSPTINYKNLVANFTVTDSFLLNISASPQTGRIPLTVILTGSSNSTISLWIWTINGIVQPETTSQITRTFTQKGSYIVGLTATNIYSQTLTSYTAVIATTSLSVLDSALDISDSDRIAGLVGSADIIHNRKGIGVKTPSYGQNFQNAGFSHPNGPSIICS